jgi:cyclohexadienyl dehydratase
MNFSEQEKFLKERKRMKKILMILNILAAMILTGCGKSTEPEAIQKIKKAGVLRVGATGDYQPMSFLDPSTGTYVGFDAALAEDLAESLGVKVEYVPTSWPTLMEDTLAGKFDLALCGITITDARKEQALMSDGYLGNGKTVLCRAEDAGIYTSLEAINRPEVRVMENPGGLNEKFARENLPEAELIIHDVNEEIPGLIAQGEADVMITEILEAGYYCAKDDRLAAPLINDPFTRGQLGALLPNGSEELLEYINAFIAEERESGRLEELAQQYIYGKDVEAETIPSSDPVPALQP